MHVRNNGVPGAWLTRCLCTCHMPHRPTAQQAESSALGVQSQVALKIGLQVRVLHVPYIQDVQLAHVRTAGE